MLVCPNCRSDQQEDARFCTACGRTLEPEEGALLRVPRREIHDEPDEPAPRPTSNLTAALALALVLTLGGGLGAWWAFRPAPAAPAPCRGKDFVSQVYPYCMEIPEGWEGGTERTVTGVLDIFSPRRTQDSVEMEVRVGPVLPGVNTATYAQEFRTSQETQGLQVSDPRGLLVGGDQGVTWTTSGRDDSGELVNQRQVVLVRGGLSWRASLTGQADAYDEAFPIFLMMLNSVEFEDLQAAS